MPLFHTTLALLLGATAAQLSGKVGPNVSNSKNITCNVKDFFPPGSDDVGLAIQAAFDKCAKQGNSVLLVPEGNYNMYTWVTLKRGSNWAFQLDGTIYRKGTGGGHMFWFENAVNFEFYSTTAKSGKGGVIQGYGFEFHKKNQYGPRIMRFKYSSKFSVHDIKLVDSPAFHLILDKCTDAEVYNIVIRGGNRGGLDGINASGSNIHVHHVEVTNKDECVTTKNPASNFLVENIYCNWSGGCAMGSLWDNTNISNIHYRNIYTVNSNQMFMIKSLGGSGTVRNVTLENFIGHSNAYGFNIDQYWLAKAPVKSAPVIRHLYVKNWYAAQGVSNRRPVFKANCVPSVSCGMSIKNFNYWRKDGSPVQHECKAARARRFSCTIRGRKADSKKFYSKMFRVKPQPRMIPKLPNDLKRGLGITREIPIPNFPTRYFPKIKMPK